MTWLRWTLRGVWFFAVFIFGNIYWLYSLIMNRINKRRKS